MRKKRHSSFIKCGKTFDINIPLQLDESEPPIVLAEVTLNKKLVNRPCVLLQYSEFIKFSLFGLNPKIFIVYRLVRESCKKNNAEILQEWEFELVTPEVLEGGNLTTSQPTVLNFCDCLDGTKSEKLTYKLEIIQIETNNVSNFAITNKTFSANLLNQAPRHIDK